MFSMTLSDGDKHYNWIKPPSCRSNENDDPRVNHLLEFYSDYVHIHPEQWEIASNIVNQVLGKIELHLREVVQLRFPGVSVGDFLPQGSASDVSRCVILMNLILEFPFAVRTSSFLMFLTLSQQSVQRKEIH